MGWGQGVASEQGAVRIRPNHFAVRTRHTAWLRDALATRHITYLAPLPGGKHLRCRGIGRDVGAPAAGLLGPAGRRRGGASLGGVVSWQLAAVLNSSEQGTFACMAAAHLRMARCCSVARWVAIRLQLAATLISSSAFFRSNSCEDAVRKMGQ